MGETERITIGLVGPCKAGKSVLKSNLSGHDIRVRHIAQEHSYVQNMWQKISNPDHLIFLDVSYETTLQRSNLKWTIEEYQVQQDRLAHARKHANLIIETDDLTPKQVKAIVLEYLSGIS